MIVWVHFPWMLVIGRWVILKIFLGNCVSPFYHTVVHFLGQRHFLRCWLPCWIHRPNSNIFPRPHQMHAPNVGPMPEEKYPLWPRWVYAPNILECCVSPLVSFWILLWVNTLIALPDAYTWEPDTNVTPQAPLDACTQHWSPCPSKIIPLGVCTQH